MIDLTSTAQPEQYAQDILLGDVELNGEINRASQQGAKFALLMAMLEQNCLYRPCLDKPAATLEETQATELTSDYPAQSLSADQQHWSTLQQTSQLIHGGHIQSAHLWLSMHPQPLSQYNNALKLDDNVIANCGLHTQSRLQQNKTPSIPIDETGLYDILQDIQQFSATAA